MRDRIYGGMCRLISRSGFKRYSELHEDKIKMAQRRLSSLERPEVLFREL